MAASRRVIARQIAKELLAGDSRTKIMQRLAAYLVSNKMQAQSELVIADVLRELASSGQLQAHVTTAYPLTDELRKVVQTYIAGAEAVKHVTLRETVDETLIGGIIIETPSKRLDASLSTRVKAIAKA